MNPETRRAAPLLVLMAIAVVVVLAVASGLGRSRGEPSPSPLIGSVPSAAPSVSLEPSIEPSSSASESASAGPSAGLSPSPSASASASAAACAVTPQTGLLPSDRLVSIDVATSATVDFVTFVFDNGSLSPAGPPRGDLTVAKPPFTYGSSGLPINLHGQHALQVRFSGMSLSNDAGEPTFTGDPDVIVDYPALKQAIQYDESEGISAWYIGYDGTACVGLVRDGSDILITIAHS